MPAGARAVLNCIFYPVLDDALSLSLSFRSRAACDVDLTACSAPRSPNVDPLALASTRALRALGQTNLLAVKRSRSRSLIEIFELVDDALKSRGVQWVGQTSAMSGLMARAKRAGGSAQRVSAKAVPTTTARHLTTRRRFLSRRVIRASANEEDRATPIASEKQPEATVPAGGEVGEPPASAMSAMSGHLKLLLTP